ncbi:MAG: hypothetical protein AMJ68_06670 [Acidithiobacillales bacterium SG8_45]|jgi:hypothetical protein|nr:MAG: hypothetical protein AMJ68_06670 [Acidithiobacillales bacterium SG8_45]
MKLSDSIEISARPETVFSWFTNLDRNYREWHPDHRDSYWLKGDSLSPGSVLYAEEYLHGKLHKLRYQMTEVLPNRHARFRILGAIGLLVPRGEFRVEPTETGARFTATLYPRCGRLLRLLMPGRVQALITHQEEEGRNLKKLLESGD